LKTPKKILYVHHGSGQGGGAVALMRLLQKLDQRKYVPLVACDYRLAEVEKFFEREKINTVNLNVNPFSHTATTWKWHTPKGLLKMIRWSFFHFAKTRKGLIEIVKREKPHIIHFNGLSLLPYATARRFFAVPIIQHIREPLNSGIFGLRRKILRYIGKKFINHFVVICKTNYNDFFPVKNENASVLYDPVELSRQNKENTKRLENQMEDGPIVFFPGGSSLGIKGFIPFISSLALLIKENPTIKAIVPGIESPGHPRDPIRREAELIISENGLEDCIQRVPFTDEVYQYYLQSDIVVAPFITAHASLAVAEAGLMKKPAIGSRLPPIEEVLKNGENGLLVNPGDAVDLAEKIKYLISHPDKSFSMGEDGYKKTVTRNDPGKYAEEVMSIYDKLLHRK
jgi:glycosyltransferase involved in cell wall biosynthesis